MDVITNKLLRQAVPLFSTMASIIIILGLGAILMLAKDVLIPIALATLLSFALAPVATKLQRWGAPRGVSVLCAVLFALLLISGIGYIVVSQASDLAAQLPSYQNVIHDKLKALSSHFAGDGVFSRASSSIKSLVSDFYDMSGATPHGQTTVVVKSEAGLLADVGEYVSPLVHPLAMAAAVLLMTAFMLGQREDLRNRLLKLMGSDDIQQTTAAIDDAGKRVGRMLLAQLSVNAGFGAAVGLGLWAIGLPSPFLWGVLAGVLRFVPYIGALAGMAPPLAVAFAFDPHWSAFLYTIALFAFIDIIVGQVIEPFLYGASAGLSPIAIVICATIWAFLWGPIGPVLSTPLTICLVVMGRHMSRLEFLDILLGDRPALEPHEMFYQRMLAGDPSEAYAQALAFLKGRSLSTYYDEIALEAIRRAHLDIVRGGVSGERLQRLIATSRSLVKSLDKVSDTTVKLARPSAEAEAAFEQVRADTKASSEVLRKEDLTPDWRGDTPVAVLYGNHPLDEAAALMLTQTFDKNGLRARVAQMDSVGEPTPSQTAEIRLVCLSFVEPLSTLHLRLASISVRRYCPKAYVMLCIWQQTEPGLIRRFTKKLRVSRIVTTISDALEAAHEFSRTSRK